jgi:type II secretory pathway pseudopilin PulG
MRAVNLIPSEQRSGAAVGAGRSGGGAYAVLGLIVGVALLALLYGLAHHQISSRRSQAATVTAQAQQASAQAARLAPYTSFIALRESRAQAVATLVNSRFDWAHVFHEFGRVLPFEVSINSLSGTIGAPVVAASTTGKLTPESSAGSGTVASATPPGAVPTFTLGGCAINQPSVALMLERLRLIDGVSEVVLQSSTKGSTGGASGGASGGCPGGDPAFTVQVNFDALPATSAVSAATKTVANASTPVTSAAPAPAAGSGTTTTSGVTSR